MAIFFTKAGGRVGTAGPWCMTFHCLRLYHDCPGHWELHLTSLCSRGPQDLARPPPWQADPLAGAVSQLSWLKLGQSLLSFCSVLFSFAWLFFSFPLGLSLNAASSQSSSWQLYRSLAGIHYTFLAFPLQNTQLLLQFFDKFVSLLVSSSTSLISVNSTVYTVEESYTSCLQESYTSCISLSDWHKEGAPCEFVKWMEVRHRPFFWLSQSMLWPLHPVDKLSRIKNIPYFLAPPTHPPKLT